MTGQTAIVAAIAALVAEGVPALERVYTDLVPRDFRRPSLLITAAGTDHTPAGKRLWFIEQRYVLTVFDVTDDYSHSDTAGLLTLQEDVLRLFLSGILLVGKRALQVRAASGGRNWDEAYIDVAVQFYDAVTEESQTSPLMEHVDVTIQTDRKKG